MDLKTKNVIRPYETAVKALELIPYKDTDVNELE